MNTPGSGLPNAPTLPPAPTDGKFRILVVEDDPSIARLVLVTLDKIGFEARHAPDGLTALQAFNQVTPHLVLLDLMLPGLDGRQVCAEIRKTSTVPIVVMTAADNEAVEVQTFKLGADDFVSKPFNPQLLVARIVANLRRTYRYDAAPAEPEAASLASPFGTNSPAPAKPGSAPPNTGRDMAKIAGIAPMSEANEKPVPVGWAKCDSCGYMGPRIRFQREDAGGGHSLMCPNCRQSDFVVFSLG